MPKRVKYASVAAPGAWFDPDHHARREQCIDDGPETIETFSATHSS